MANQLRGGSNDKVGPWLESLAPTTAVFCRAVMSAPWGFRIEAREEATFHIVTRGSGILEVEGLQDPLRLEAGDMAILARGSAHQVRDREDSGVLSLERAVAGGTAEGKVFAFGGQGPDAVFICGACRLGPSARSDNGPSDLLPPVITHRCDSHLVALAEWESESLDAGGEAVLKSVLSLLVTQALRSHIATRGLAAKNALASPTLARAVAFVHAHLHEDIDLEELCAQVHVSRTVLSQRFTEALGVSPIQYVRQVRLAHAADLLERTDLGLQRIAKAVGYRSASAFGRAFRREYGVTPGAYRGAES